MVTVLVLRDEREYERRDIQRKEEVYARKTNPIGEVNKFYNY